MIVNLTNKKYIARKPFFAVSFGARLQGMIGRRFYESGFDAMVFERCNNIHTLFMGQNIDVIFLDADRKVVGLRRGLVRWLPWVRCAKAVTTIELPAGLIDYSGTEVGHVINVAEESVAELAAKPDDKRLVREMESIVPFKESRK
ncbi:MAG: DUF192 domain-containing protein [Victivallaceae bacterium]|nr:DUF192 domain-containing protein [Victivallaceae bacterium]